MQDRSINIGVTASLWRQLFRDVSYELAEQAICKVIMTSKDWPTAAEIRDALDSLKTEDDIPPPADVAREQVCKKLDPYKVPTWTHPAIGQAVSRIGGMRRLCESENSSIDRAHFIKAYEAIVNRGKDEALNLKVIALVSSKRALLAGGSLE